jgi:hypothetical protein
MNIVNAVFAKEKTGACSDSRRPKDAARSQPTANAISAKKLMQAFFSAAWVRLAKGSEGRETRDTIYLFLASACPSFAALLGWRHIPQAIPALAPCP